MVMKDLNKVGVRHDGRVYLGTLVKTTYNPKMFHIYVPELGFHVEADVTIRYGHALVDMVTQEMDEGGTTT